MSGLARGFQLNADGVLLKPAFFGGKEGFFLLILAQYTRSCRLMPNEASVSETFFPIAMYFSEEMFFLAVGARTEHRYSVCLSTNTDICVGYAFVFPRVSL